MFPNEENKTELNNPDKELIPTVAEKPLPQFMREKSNTPSSVNLSALNDTTPAVDIPKKSKKRLIMLSAFGSFIVLLAIAYVFLIFMPSKPANVYAIAIVRSGEALDKVTKKVTKKSQLDRYKKAEYSGSAKLKVSPLKIDGTMGLKFDESHLDMNINAKVSQDGQTEKTYKAQLLTELNKNATYPDIYFIINGIKDLGLNQTIQKIEKFDNTWIKVDEKYIKDTIDQYKSLLSSGGDKDVTENNPNITNDDISELTNISTNLVKDFVFTDNQSKSILVNKKFIAKEKSEGLNTYHYEMGLNASNVKSFCKEGASRFADSSIYKKFSNAKPDDINKAKEDAKKSCDEINEADINKQNFDMWVDAKYKLVHKIRVYDEISKDIYTEIGQIYKGGDDLHFFVNFDDKKEASFIRFTLDTNTSNLVSKGRLTADFKSDNDKGNVELSFTGKPLEGEVKLKKPTNPKSIQDLLKELGLTDSSGALNSLGVNVEAPAGSSLNSPLQNL